MNAFIAIALSVLMHVAWNLMVRSQGKQVRLLWWALAAHGVLLAPWGLYALVTEAHWLPQLIGFLVTSALANMSYFIALDRAYHHAPVALVYPVVRASPLLIGLWGVLFFNEALGGNAWLAMTISVCGLLLLASTAWRNADGYALPWALAAAFSTSVYSLSDKAATVYLPSLASVLGFISVGYALSFFAITLLLRREQGRWVPECKPPLWVMLCSGLFVGLAYVLVVHAMRTLPAATVVTFTNAGIVLAGLLSMLLFRERAHWRMRLAGMLVITAGLILLGWAHR